MEFADGAKPGDKMPQVADVCRPEFVRYLQELGKAGSSGHGEKPYDSEKFALRYFETNGQWNLRERGDEKSVDWKLNQWTVEDNGTQCSLHEDPSTSLIEEVHCKNKAFQSVRRAEGELKLELTDKPSEGKSIRLSRNGEVVLTIDEGKPLTLKKLYEYFLLRTEMFENQSQDLHAQKARGEGAYTDTDGLCEVVTMERMTHMKVADSLTEGKKFISESHPYQNLLARVLTGQMIPGEGIYCDEGPVDSHTIVSRIEENVFVDPETGMLHVRLVNDEDFEEGHGPDALAHQVAWAMHTLALLWDEQELQNERSKQLMSKLMENTAEYRKTAFELLLRDGTFTVADARKIPNEMYTHNLMALATYAVRAQDKALILKLKRSLLEDAQTAVKLPEQNKFLITHFIQVAGILAPEWSRGELAQLRPLFQAYSEVAQTTLAKSKDPFHDTFDGTSSAHALVGLREFARLGLLDDLEAVRP